MKILLILSLIGLVGCGRDDNNSGSAEIAANGSQTLYLDDANQLPECNESNNNQLVYIEGDSSFKACKSNAWVDVNVIGEKGEKGDIGATGEAGISIVSSRVIQGDDLSLCPEYSTLEKCYFNGGQITIYSDGYVEITSNYSYDYYWNGAVDGEIHIDRYGSNGSLMLPPSKDSGFIVLDWQVSRKGVSFNDLFLVYNRKTDSSSIVFDTNGNGNLDKSDEIVTNLNMLD